MLSASQIKYVKSLQQKKFRDLYNTFIAEGEKIVNELPGSNLQVDEIFATQDWVEKNRGLFSSNIPTHTASCKDMERISGLKTPQSVIAVIKKPDVGGGFYIEPNDQILVLDTIQDPGNFGTIIRTAHWFGIKHIVCSKNTADLFNPKVIQATMGSFARVKVSYLDLVHFLKEKSGHRNIFGATLRGEDIKDCTPSKGSILVIGNESKGISKNILPLLTKEITITTGASKDSAESLNAAIAAGILMAWINQAL